MSPVSRIARLVVSTHVDFAQMQAWEWVVVLWMLWQIDVTKPVGVLTRCLGMIKVGLPGEDGGIMRIDVHVRILQVDGGCFGSLERAETGKTDALGLTDNSAARAVIATVANLCNLDLEMLLRYPAQDEIPRDVLYKISMSDCRNTKQNTRFEDVVDIRFAY